MAGRYAEELVYTESSDGLPLEGAVIRPVGQPIADRAIVWIHGLTGKFYSRSTIMIGRELASRGWLFVTGNNRGHDFGTVYRQADGAVRLGGGAWEHFDEAPRDIAAWIGYAARLGVQGALLLGHSLGALKVAAYQAEYQDQRVQGLIAASPPTRAGQLRPDLVEQARQMVAEGRGTDLLPWNISPAGGGTVSAQTYLNRAEVGIDSYGFFSANPPIGRVRCPVLALYGTDEAWVGTADDLETIRRNALAAARVDTAIIDGADHVYTNCELAVATVIAGWAAGVSASSGMATG